MRQIINGFFHQLSITPRVIMEADDTETIKGLVSVGLGYAVLPEFALRRQPRFFQVCRVAGKKLVRKQALAMPRSDYTRPLTETIARYLTEVRLRKLHLARPDLIPYPIASEVYC